MKKFWIYEIISIICFISYSVFAFIVDDIAHPLGIVFAIVSITSMSIGIFKRKIKTIKKIGLILLHLIIYVIVFYIYVGVVISIENHVWGITTKIISNVYLQINKLAVLFSYF